MNGSITPIETRYNGYRFRSRLEARWAVFFDTLGIEYRYEHEGFNLDGLYYLPDFYIPSVEGWFEVKGDVELSDVDREKIERLARASNRLIGVLAGDIDGYQRVRICGRSPVASAVEWLFGRWVFCPICHSAAIVVTLAPVATGNNEVLCLSRQRKCTAARMPVSFRERVISAQPWTDPRIMRAFDAARSARFEHGENGR